MLIDRFDAFFFDLDGVIYIGHQPLPGATKVINALKQRRIPFLFLTNEPRLERSQFVTRLHRMGITVAVEQIISVGYATARWLQENLLPGSPVYVLGGAALQAEIRNAGLTVISDSSMANESETAAEVAAVIVGFDQTCTPDQIKTAVHYINSGALFLATSEDMTYPTPDGPAPATGTMVALIKKQTNVSPVVIGKPAPYMFLLGRNALPPDCEKIAMVGDNLSTDISGAINAGITAIWVNHGLTIPVINPRPHFIIDSVAQLLEI